MSIIAQPLLLMLGILTVTAWVYVRILSDKYSHRDAEYIKTNERQMKLLKEINDLKLFQTSLLKEIVDSKKLIAELVEKLNK